MTSRVNNNVDRLNDEIASLKRQLAATKAPASVDDDGEVEVVRVTTVSLPGTPSVLKTTAKREVIKDKDIIVHTNPPGWGAMQGGWADADDDPDAVHLQDRDADVDVDDKIKIDDVKAHDESIYNF